MSSDESSDFVIPKMVDCVYTSCYCEENVWHLAKLILEANKTTADLKCYIIFVLNSNKCVYLWKQKSQQKSQQNEGLIFWDYHVFLVVQHKEKTLVFDLDTTLPFPVPFSQYAKEAVREDFKDQESKRYFRVIEAEQFLLKFSSDRGHMLEGEHWMSPPPSYPPILNKDSEHNLDAFISMDSSNEFGQVLNVDEFKTRFS